LGGQPALEVIERAYIQNLQAPLPTCYAAITAIRVHAEQVGKLDRDRLAASFCLALDNPRLAEWVIPDLARWKHWNEIGRLEKLYCQVPEGYPPHIKLSIVNYLRSCPLPTARQALARCEQADPIPVRQSAVIFAAAEAESSSSDIQSDFATDR
jgi:hypothetical protein